MQQKCLLRGSLKQYRPSSRNKKNLKQSNFIPKESRKRAKFTFSRRNNKRQIRNK